MTTFADFALPPFFLNALQRMGITTPTPIQEGAIPLVLQGKDLLASAQTGTGKTIAYTLPLLIRLIENPKIAALILAPTRELALQVQQTLEKILGNGRLKSALLIGGAPMMKQIRDLKHKPQLIVGTPGRIMDHLQRRTLHLNDCQFLVIDEADRMLDMGFEHQLDMIIKSLPKTRQTLMFSATLPPDIHQLSKRYLTNPEHISIGTLNQAAPKIQQEVVHTKGSEKPSQLLKELEERKGSIIIFVRTRKGADRLSKDLNQSGHQSNAIHGDLPQRRREKVLQSFRSNKSRILVATDVAARGLDIPHVMHVINYDLPECPEDYVHRIGRTGRAGAEGHALCLLTPEDGAKWRAIGKIIDPESKNPLFDKSQFPHQVSSKSFRGRRRPFNNFKRQNSSFRQKRY